MEYIGINLQLQGPEDLHIYPEDIKVDQFRLSLYANHHQQYSFKTPDCPFLTLALVTPYQVNCQELKNLTMCTR